MSAHPIMPRLFCRHSGISSEYIPVLYGHCASLLIVTVSVENRRSQMTFYCGKLIGYL